MKGGRQLSEWNKFTQKIFEEGKKKNPKYEFRQALKDASARKSEMGSMHSSTARGLKKSRKSRKSNKKSKTHKKH